MADESMTNEGEQQEAVCGTCGAAIELRGVNRDRWAHVIDPHMAVPVCGTCSGDPRDGDGYHAYDCPERTGRIPAPVVPSDERKERTMNVAEAIEIVNAATNKESGEDCDACTAIEDTCPYHDGIEAGVRWLGDVVKRAVDDPESVAVPRG